MFLTQIRLKPSKFSELRALIPPLLMMLAPVSGLAQEYSGCGSLKNAFGPFDYSDPETSASLSMVEQFHFTQEVEQLRSGKSSSIPGDLDYTLRAFPNHHRALNSLARYSLQGRNMNGAHYSVDCYFDRAIRWRPEDAAVRMIYANLLSKRGKIDAAREQYETALRLAPDSAEVNYNAGLFYLAQHEHAKAMECARIAYAEGYSLPGLKKMLQKAGAWQDR